MPGISAITALAAFGAVFSNRSADEVFSPATLKGRAWQKDPEETRFLKHQYVRDGFLVGMSENGTECNVRADKPALLTDDEEFYLFYAAAFTYEAMPDMEQYRNRTLVPFVNNTITYTFPNGPIDEEILKNSELSDLSCRSSLSDRERRLMKDVLDGVEQNNELLIKEVPPGEPADFTIVGCDMGNFSGRSDFPYSPGYRQVIGFDYKQLEADPMPLVRDKELYRAYNYPDINEENALLNAFNPFRMEGFPIRLLREKKIIRETVDYYKVSRPEPENAEQEEALLAALRGLFAHEIGHALGLGHTMPNSPKDFEPAINCTSVMSYFKDDVMPGFGIMDTALLGMYYRRRSAPQDIKEIEGRYHSIEGFVRRDLFVPPEELNIANPDGNIYQISAENRKPCGNVRYGAYWDAIKNANMSTVVVTERRGEEQKEPPFYMRADYQLYAGIASVVLQGLGAAALAQARNYISNENEADPEAAPAGARHSGAADTALQRAVRLCDNTARFIENRPYVAETAKKAAVGVAFMCPAANYSRRFSQAALRGALHNARISDENETRAHAGKRLRRIVLGAAGGGMREFVYMSAVRTLALTGMYGTVLAELALAALPEPEPGPLNIRRREAGGVPARGADENRSLIEMAEVHSPSGNSR